MIPTRFRRWSSFLAVISAVIPALVLIGWWRHIEILKSPVLEIPPTNPVTAVGLILTGVAFYFTFKHSSLRSFGKLISIIILLLGFIKLGSLIYPSWPNIDLLLFPHDLTNNSLNVGGNSMSVLTAINFMLMGAVLLLQERRTSYSHALAALIVISTLFSMLGHAFRIPEFYHLDVLYPMSIYTAISFLLFALAALFAQPDKGWMKEFSSKYEGGSLSRVLLPIAILVPIGLGYLRLWGHWKQLISTELGVALLVSGIVIAFVGVVAHNVKRLNYRDEQRRKILEQLEVVNSRSEANLQSILNATLDSFMLLNRNYEIIAFNESYRILIKRLIGKELTIGMKIFDLISPDRGEEILPMLDRVSRREVFQYQVSYTLSSGIVWLSTTITPALTREQEVTGYCFTIYDITSTKRAEHILRASEERFRALVESSIDMFSITDSNGKLKYVSPNVKKILGYESDEFMMLNTLDMIHPEDVDDVRSKVVAMQGSEGDRVSFSFRIRHQSGTWLSLEGTSVNLFETDGVRGRLSIYHDVTEKRNQDHTILQLNSSLFDFQNAIYRSSIVSRADRTGIITFVNDNFVAISGYSEKELIGQNHRIINSGYHPKSFWVDMWKTIASGKVWRADVKNRAKDGSYYWVDTFVMPFLDETGQVTEFLSIRNDITYRIESTRIIEKLSLVASKTSNAVTITDADGLVEWVNASFTEITGYALDDAKGRDMRFLQGPETEPSTVKRIAERLKEHRPVSEELINYTKTGKKIWMKLSITPVFSETGEVKNFISIHSDISELKEYENSITSIARELASLIENANVPIFGIDGAGRINEWNREAVSVLGFEKDQIIGANASTRILDASARLVFDKIVYEVMEGIPAGSLELPIITRDKRKLIMLMSGSPRRNTSGQVTGGIFVAQNITELTEYRLNLEHKVTERTRELHEALSKERELVDMKSRFISIASHEFRTPLSTISIAAGLVRKHFQKLSPQEIEDKLQSVQKQVEHMSYMLDDVLLIEKANAGKLTVQKKEINIHEFFTSLCQEVEKSRGSTHIIRVQENLLVQTLLTDEKILRSIFINLLTNAIKFSPDAKGVDVELTSTVEYTSVKVKDYGIGIPEEDIVNLFEPFFRGGNVSAIQGTGLGLSIIRKSLDLVKGSISVTSVVGKGTEFNVTLPTLHG